MNHDGPDWMIDELNKIRADNAQLQYSLRKSENVVDELAQMVKRLARSLRKADPDNSFPEMAINYLERKELLGSPLR